MATTFVDFVEQCAFPNISVINMYAVVEDARRTLGFHTPDSNLKIMAQAEYVTKQYRKYLGGLREPILDTAESSKPQELIDVLLEEKINLDLYPDNEEKALFYTVRDVWLTQLINAIQYWIDTDGHIDDLNMYRGEIDG